MALILAFILLPLVLLMLAVVIPLSVPWHFLLKLFGHQGFTEWEGNKLRYKVPWWGVLLSLSPIVLIVLF